MPELHQVLAQRVSGWRAAGYPCEYAAIRELLEYAVEGEAEGKPFPESGSLRFLRSAQLRAFETYWYLRLVERTPHVQELYARLFEDPSDELAALGLNNDTFLRLALRSGVGGVLDKIKSDEAFAVEYKLAALRETLTLAYPSYILALAMGAGKTVLIGAIIASEFAMALEYPDASEGEDGIQFIENALVFAPGKTIIESLRELARIPYDRILPPRLHKQFDAALKLTFTRDGEKDIPVIRGSSFNLVVTNTEKIRIQARPVRRGNLGMLQLAAFEEQAREEANLRLQAIASLPHLGIFSDEAHHTYGQSLGKDLKRVRQTVDYLKAHSPNLICVVNTTGTPYFEHQPLKDVVVWYGLSEGIKDGILKEVAGNIQAWNVGTDQAPAFVRHVVSDFFADYAGVALPDGAAAKLAIYFPQTDDLEDLRPHVELALAQAGQSTDIVLAHTSKSGVDTLVAFNRLNDPTSPHRVILLVNIGTEGWNCPSLFATALARKLTSSNNFVLQAASRCLRQVPGNAAPARIYLSAENRGVLDKQLQETYGETIADLDTTKRATKRDRIVLNQLKLPIPPIVLRRIHRVVRRTANDLSALVLTAPTETEHAALTGVVLGITPQVATRSVLRAMGDALMVKVPIQTVDVYWAATELAGIFHLSTAKLLRVIRATYPGAAEMPTKDLTVLAKQLERQLATYELVEVEEDEPAHIVKLDGFDRETDADGQVQYTAAISYPVDHGKYMIGPQLLLHENKAGYGFHYSPYNFDSAPEVSYFEQLIQLLNAEQTKVADVYFVGALTDASKTDLVFEYQASDGKSRCYTPDFLVRCRNDRWLLVEIKRASARNDPVEGEFGFKASALRGLVDRNPDRLQYTMVFATGEAILTTDLHPARAFSASCGSEAVKE